MAAEVRCPMCSKMNPAGADACRFCGARLKPAWSQGQGDAPADQPGGDEPDWLRQLRSDAPANPDTPSEGSEPADDVPDWLSRIRERASGDEDSPSKLFVDDDAGSDPDWMKGVDAGENGPVDFGGGDWLARLGDSGEQAAGETTPSPSPQQSENSGSTADLSDWIKSLDEDRPQAAPPVESQSPDQDGALLDSRLFADELSAQSEAKSAPAAPEDDWQAQLAAFQSGQEEPSSTPQEEDTLSAWKPAETSQPAESDPGDLSWLRGFDRTQDDDTSDETPAESAEEAAPEWGSLAEDDDPSVSLPASEAAREELPDWLSGFDAGGSASGDATDSEEPQAPQWHFEADPSQLPETPAGQEALPDWLSAAPDEPDTGAVEPGELQGEVPSWLSGFEEAAPVAAESAAPASSEEEILPSWLHSDQSTEPPAPAEDKPVQGEASPAGELPAWFSAFNDEPAASDEDLVDATAGSFGSQEEEPLLAVPGAEHPAWLQSLAETGDETEQAAEPAAPNPSAGLQPFIEEDTPDWLTAFQGQPASESAVPPLISMEASQPPADQDDRPFAVDLPDWLSDEAEHQRELAAGETGPASAPEDELAQAELPSWVAAMRPVETAISDEAGAVESDQRVERAGPLAGMRGVLPAEDVVIRYRKPPVYSAKLRVSEKQRGHASLLEGILAQETQPLLIPAARTKAPQVILRVLVGLFLMIVLGGTLLANVQLIPTPELYPPEIIDLYDQIESLPADAPVLLAVDYEPGLSGEMRFAAAMVIDHLMAKNARLAIVSTVPTGPALADRLLQDVYVHHGEYDLAGRVTNLGYLPGGTISLLEFARAPQEAAQKTVDGLPAWEQPALAGVDGITQFARILVMTDRAEVGRDWVEQVQPFLGGVPLLIVSSAQAGPLLEPFVESNQVQGMVSGLMGGTLYGQRTGRQAVNPALGHYGAYQVGALLAFLMVLVGAIFSAVMAIVGRKGKDRE